MANVIWLDEAVEEARAAEQWYRARSEQAADDLLAELDVAVAAVAADRRRYPQHVHGSRRYLLRRFPYLLIYREERDDVLVMAFQHGKRRPGYWRERTRDKQ